MHSLEEITESLTNDRNTIVNNLTTMGISDLTGNETFTSLAPRILEIAGGDSIAVKSLSELKNTGMTHNPIDFTLAEVGIYVNDMANYNSFYYKDNVNPSQDSSTNCNFKPCMLVVEKETGTAAPSSGFFFAWMYAFDTSGDLYILHFFVNSSGQVNKDNILVNNPKCNLALKSLSVIKNQNLSFDAIDFSMAEKGIYINDISNYTNFYYKNSLSGTGTSSGGAFIPYFLIVKEDISGISTPSQNLYFASMYCFNYNYGNIVILNFYVNTSGGIASDTVMIKNQYVLNTSAQDIVGVKTFSSLPECSATPTTNNQLTNKSYVDGAISSAITSALGGNY